MTGIVSVGEDRAKSPLLVFIDFTVSVRIVVVGGGWEGSRLHAGAVWGSLLEFIV